MSLIFEEAPRAPAETQVERLASDWIAPYSQSWHLERARDWLIYLDPAATLEMRLAVLTHDIERMFPGGPSFDKRRGRWDDPDYLYAHGARSAEVVGVWLHGTGPAGEGVDRNELRRLITLHEFGGLDGADLVQAADSLSFLETLRPIVSAWVANGECDVAQARAKHQYMADRVRLDRARKLAEPLLGGGVGQRDRAVSADPSPYRVGLIVPSSNVTIETELPRLLSRHPAAAGRGFTYHSSRAVLHNVDPDALRQMVDQADRSASELADARIDVLAYGCLIAIMAGGPGAHEKAEERLAATLSSAGCEAPVTSSAGALVRCLQRLRVKRVSIVAPYMKPLTAMVVEYLGTYGIEVISSVSLEVADNVAVGRLDPRRLPDLAGTLELGRSDAVVLSACVQMPSLPVIAEAQEKLGLPVVSAATATAAEVLSLLGEEPRIESAGAAL